jgi:hypothetical protein
MLGELLVCAFLVVGGLGRTTIELAGRAHTHGQQHHCHHYKSSSHFLPPLPFLLKIPINGGVPKGNSTMISTNLSRSPRHRSHRESHLKNALKYHKTASSISEF